MASGTIKYEGDQAIYMFAYELNSKIALLDPGSALGPKELHHYVEWIKGYHLGIRAVKRMVHHIENVMYDGMKNNIIHTIKKKFADGDWIFINHGEVDIPEIFKIEGELVFEKSFNFAERTS